MIRRPLLATACLALAACSEPQETTTASEGEAAPASAPEIAPAAGAGIVLPDGFRSSVFADDLGATRHLAIRADGVVYASMRTAKDGHGLVAMADDDGDGAADRVEYFGDRPGTGLAIHDGHLYFSSDTEVLRYRLDDNLVPSAAPEIVVSGFPEQRQHATKPMTFDGAGNMYVTVGAPSNACQERDRTPGSLGQQPCPLLDLHGGIWKFDAATPGQVHGEDGERYATGIRNGLAQDWNRAAGALYFISHGRDQLAQLFPEHFDDAQNAELPAEEFHRAEPGSNHGWPYTYWNHHIGARMVGPEYGGDGEKQAEAGNYRDPLATFPAHWAPNDLVFYTGDAFPERYRNGAFIAFHGSWNRAPLPQAGYNVAFIPMDAAGEVTGAREIFADGFKGKEVLESPRDAEHRPTGLAVGPDGALYVADDVKGRIWKIFHAGE